MPGVLPQPTRRRRNAPTIPTTNLPAGGYRGSVPKSPYALGPAGKAWWKWAWRTPSAAAWGPGDTYYVARRAVLEDDLASLEMGDVDLADYLDVEDTLALTRLGDAMKRLKGLAGGRLGVLKLMGDLDKRLGLDPKAIPELRWSIVDDTPEADEKKPTLAAVPDAWRNALAAG